VTLGIVLDDWRYGVDGCLDDLELLEEDEVTITRWDEEQQWLYHRESGVWEEFVKWEGRE